MRLHVGLRPDEAPSERGALSLLRLRGVTASGDRSILLALQIIADRVPENLRRRAVVLILQVAVHRVAVHNRRRHVVLDGEVVAHRITNRAGSRRIVLYREVSANGISRAGTRGRGSDQHRRAVVLELQVAVYAGPANLILRRACGHVLNLQIPSDRRARTNAESASANLHISCDLRIAKNQIAAIQSHVSSDAAGSELTALTTRHGDISSEKAVINAVAGASRFRTRRHRREDKRTERGNAGADGLADRIRSIGAAGDRLVHRNSADVVQNGKTGEDGGI